MSFAAAAEQEIRSGREDTAFGVIDHLEVPFLVAGLWIDRTHGAVAFLFRAIPNGRAPGGAAARAGRCATRIFLPLFPRNDIGVASDGGVVVPRRYIEDTRPRTERGRIPVRAALRARFDPRAFRRRLGLRISHGSSVIEAEVPVLLHERFTEQKLSGGAVEHVGKA